MEIRKGSKKIFGKIIFRDTEEGRGSSESRRGYNTRSMFLGGAYWRELAPDENAETYAPGKVEVIES